ncbi:MAG TPA: HDOD domain-containing protein [Spirochaetota bacterium]|nr:HDOD domain-containing protein [Spirochaetota bacterium]
MAIPNTSDTAARVAKGEPYSFSFHYLSEDVVRYINALFAKILAGMDHIFLLDTFITIIREICINAVKANAKRVYFRTIGINIDDAERYPEGIEMFKKNVISHFEIMDVELKNSDYRVSFSMKKDQKGLVIQVLNNSVIRPEEMARISMRMEKARHYEDFSEAYEEIYDDTEGAGLGIVLTVLLLKNSGIGVENYKIIRGEKDTRTLLSIPFDLRPREITTTIKKQILTEIEGIPTFPKNIMDLRQLCANPESSIVEISEKITLDPALSSDVLKLANSAGFIAGKRIETIAEAIKNIGLKNLNAILLATSARSILDKRYSRFEQIWAHCNQVAFYARRIAMKYKLARMVENAFLAGLLHDLGKIIMLSTDLGTTNKIAAIVKDRKIRTSTVMEEISVGISHASIGEMIAGKWAFPDYLVESIRCHHTPLNADEKHRDTVFVIYLANMMCGIEARRYQLYYTEDEVLARFALTSDTAFDELHADLKTAYANRTE